MEKYWTEKNCIGYDKERFTKYLKQGLRAGRVTILPSTFSGSPRNMHQNYLDAMAFVAKKGKPDLFITFTCNPKWCEITDNLLAGQTTNDRPDLVARVFMLKLKALKLDLKNKFCLGVVCGHVDVIEFQKRGLPHCHMLLHFQDDFKLRNADDIDALISSQIPDKEKEPDLYDIIKSSMIHGPCGHLNKSSPCMVDGSCSKDYPKAFNESTVLNQNGYKNDMFPNNEHGWNVYLQGQGRNSSYASDIFCQNLLAFLISVFMDFCCLVVCLCCYAKFVSRDLISTNQMTREKESSVKVTLQCLLLLDFLFSKTFTFKAKCNWSHA